MVLSTAGSVVKALLSGRYTTVRRAPNALDRPDVAPCVNTYSRNRIVARYVPIETWRARLGVRPWCLCLTHTILLLCPLISPHVEPVFPPTKNLGSGALSLACTGPFSQIYVSPADFVLRPPPRFNLVTLLFSAANATPHTASSSGMGPFWSWMPPRSSSSRAQR